MLPRVLGALAALAWRGRALADRLFKWFEERIDAFHRGELSQPPDRLVPFFLYYLKPVWPIFAALVIAGIIGASIEVALMAFVGSIIDMMRASENPAAFFAEHGTTLMWMAAVALILRPLMSLLVDLIRHQAIDGPFNARVRWKAHGWVLRQSLGYFQNDFAGRVAARVLQVGPAVRDVATSICDVVLWVVVHWIGTFVLFADADWRLVLPLGVWLSAYIASLFYFVPRIELLSRNTSEARSALTGRIVDSYTNMTTVKLFSHTDREDAYAREGLEEHLKRYQAQLRLNTWMELYLYSINGAVLVVTTGLAIWLWTRGEVTIGAIAVVTGLIVRLMAMSGWFMRSMAQIFDNIGVVQESMMTIARPHTVVDRADAKPLRVIRGEIRYEGIRFHYGKEGGVIDNLSLVIRPGEKVGLVGRSGAGKSTLVNLLLRFFDLEDGCILIDGQDIASVTQDSLRAQIGMVTQDTSLLHRSIRDNILYGRPDAGEAAMIAAARRAQAHDFILELEDAKGRRGYAAHVGERGVKLSGGQRQRIAIARVLLKNAPILILDEATSALDSEVEAAIQEQLYNLMEGKTVIAIAHRLSTIAAMDRLVIMDRGRIVEEGSHAELLKRGGLYADLWMRQSGGFLAKEAAE
ncbi:MAG TPA: ABC transporter ATP-binding protein [Hyphomicrobiaceae bacterium]|nr:ABC transporter ATP-binding protein [Hyphomicrobiaceae bacterium]